MQPLTAGLVQLANTDDRAANLRTALRLVDECALAGADLVVLPENADQVAPRPARLAAAEDLEGPFVSEFREKAAKHGRWILVGSFAERIDGDSRVHNTSVLVGPGGFLAAVYRKLHLFDATTADGVSYRESEGVKPGRELVSFDTGRAKLGLSICYDLRFPELYRRLSERGVEVLTVPSAFTVPTGEAHWHVLLRARAIENQAFVLAPAQAGDHGHGRRSFGHSLAVDPWGRVLAEIEGDSAGFVLAHLDPATLETARRDLPALRHRRIDVRQDRTEE